MKIDQIIERFEECKSSQSYKRINADHPIDLYVGYNENDYKTFVVVSNGELENVESTKMINVTIAKRIDGKLNLSFSLLDDSMSDIFYQFCNDIIQKTNNINEDNAITFTIKRWKKWIQMFKNPHSLIMSENEIRGLLGELIFLKENMFKKYGVYKSLLAWIGSSMCHKDYEIDNTWFEVKTIRENSLTVEISSIEQLESNKYGELILVKLEPSTTTIEEPILLNSYIKSIEELLENNEQLNIFYEKLDQRNYLCEDEYDNYVYCIKGIEKYKVEDGFPRITSEELKNGIARVKYDIYINELKDFKL